MTYGLIVTVNAIVFSAFCIACIIAFCLFLAGRLNDDIRKVDIALRIMVWAIPIAAVYTIVAVVLLAVFSK